MHKAKLAELLLTMVFGRRRASEVVGDLLEQETGSKGSFLVSILSTLIFVTWRWGAAIAVAVISTLIALNLYGQHFSDAQHEMTQPKWAMICVLVSSCIWSVVVLNAIGFGINSKLNRVGLGLSILLAIVACVKSHPFVPGCAIFVVAGCIATCMARSSLRREFGTLVASTAAHAAVFSGIFFCLINSLSDPQTGIALIGMHFYSYWLLSLIFGAMTLVYTRRVFLSDSATA